MRQLKLLLFPSLIIVLFIAQLYFLQISTFPIPNLILALFIYILLYDYSPIKLVYLAFFIELLNFIILGIYGTTIIILAPLSSIAHKIQEHLYEKILTPCLFISIYEITLAGFITIHTNTYSLSHNIQNICINYLTFLIIYFIYPPKNQS